ncbi:MAG TPA: hydrolase [Bacteroidales bacterium]|nr:hydrolase [Bacteroidales bacterium]
MEKANYESENVCCPRIDPALWEDRNLDWHNKMFVKDRVHTFMFMPLDFGRVMSRIGKKISNAGAVIPDYLALSDHTSKWNMDIYVAVDREVPGAVNTTISGKFFSKIYEGPFSDTGKWCKDFDSVVKSRGSSVKKLFMWYTTCPKCAKKYGKNYVAVIGELN